MSEVWKSENFMPFNFIVNCKQAHRKQKDVMLNLGERKPQQQKNPNIKKR